MNRIVLSQGLLLNGNIQIGNAPNIVPVTTSQVTVTGSDITNNAATGWGNADAYSKERYTGSAYVSAVAGQTKLSGMFGLNSDPLTDRNYTSLDYAWYTAADGTAQIYESGAYVGSFGPYTTSDVLSIEYTASSVIYRQNGVVKRTVGTSAGRTFYFDSSFYSTGYKLKDVRFGANRQGTEIYYDGNGNRRIARSYQTGNFVEESYHFDSQNRLIETYGGGLLTSVRGYDKAGRQTAYVAYSSPGVMQERRTTTYNANGQQLVTENRDGGNNVTATIKYNYADSYDAAGNLKKYTVENASGTRYLQTYTYDYLKANNYQQQAINGRFDVYYSNGTTTSYGTTQYYYDANGNQIKITDSQDATKNRDLIVTTQGQVLQQLQNGKKQYYYYAKGESVGSVGDISSANFDFNYTPVGTNYPAQSPSSYVVNQGDTLRSISLAVFGDSTLCYIIADANGLRSDADLKAGQTLTIPNQITNVHNDYKTFKPYNAGQLIGDTTPYLPTPDPLPPPEGGGGCGIIGQIIIAIVVIVVMYYTGVYMEGWETAAVEASGDVATEASIAGYYGTTNAVVNAGGGNLAGQAVGNAIGVQHGFNWGRFAGAVVGAGIGASFGQGGVAGTNGLGIKDQYGQMMANGAINNAVNQGVNIVTGQQEKFDWRNVAAAAISAPITSAFGKDVGKVTNSQFVARVAAGALRETISAAVHGGGRVNFVQLAADAFGNMLGNDMVAQLNRAGTQQTAVLSNIYNEAEAANALANAQANPVGVMSDSGQYLGTSPELDAGYRTYRTQGAGGFSAGDISPSGGLPPDTIDARMSSAGDAARQVTSLDQTIVGSDGQPRTVSEFIQHLRNGGGDDYDRMLGSFVLRDRMGYALGTLSGSVDELRGGPLSDWSARSAVNGDYGPAAAADRFLSQQSADANVNAQRLDLFGNGVGSTGLGVSVDVSFRAGFASLASSMGIEAGEAAAKVSWNTYTTMLNAAADAGIGRIEIGGAWRPEAQDLRNYFLTSNEMGLAGLSQADRTNALNSALKASGFDPAKYGYSPHMDGRALDISRLDDTWVSRGSATQPEIVRDFSYALKDRGASQVIGPWMTYGVSSSSLGPDPRAPMENGFITNILKASVERQHRTHEHFTVPW